ncbi:unnamed protein product, partial [Larinioides sclopetarius]
HHSTKFHHGPGNWTQQSPQGVPTPEHNSRDELCRNNHLSVVITPCEGDRR